MRLVHGLLSRTSVMVTSVLLAWSAVGLVVVLDVVLLGVVALRFVGIEVG